MSAADRRAAAAITATLVLSACAQFNAPPGTVPAPAAAAQSVHGGWIEIPVIRGGTAIRIAGELIAVDSARFWIQTTNAGRLWVPRDAIADGGRVTLYDWPRGAMASLAALGALSTISNGWFLVFTTPTWILSSTIAGAAETRRAQAKVTGKSLTELLPYCRFPQGLPPAMESLFTRFPP